MQANLEHRRAAIALQLTALRRDAEIRAGGGWAEDVRSKQDALRTEMRELTEEIEHED